MSAFEPRDPAYASRVAASFAGQSLMTTLGVSLDEVVPGRVVVSLPYAPHILQQHGFVHGGAVASLADTAAGYAALSLMEPGFGVLTAELKINFLTPGRGERLVAEGQVVRSGRVLTVAQATVFVESAGDRTALAILTATMMRIEGRAGIVD